MRKHLTSRLEIKSVEDNGQFEGYASVFNIADSYGDIVVQNAFKKAISDFGKGKKPKLLWQHDTREPIGVIEDIYEDDYGLFIKGRLLLELPKAKEAYCLLINHAIEGLSIGYQLLNSYYKGGKRYLTDIDLAEISIVTFPACKPATVESIKTNNNLINTIRTINNQIKELLWKTN